MGTKLAVERQARRRSSPESIAETLEQLRKTFRSGVTRPYDWRRDQLKRLRRMLVDQEPAIVQALEADLGKSHFESYLTEITPALAETDVAIRQLKRWMKPQRVPTPLAAQPGRSRIIHEPLGVMLIMGPWNYPFHLIVLPMIGAIAAGNCVIVKPSSRAPQTSATLTECVSQYLDQEAVRVVEGDAEVATQLLAEQFDHIFFTGSERVGRKVMSAAAKHLTPVTLELGGKSPCLVLDDASLPTAARRIAWGKFLNAGQSCVAPDYVLADAKTADELIALIQTAIERFFGPSPQDCPDFGRIIDDVHFDRLCGLLDSGEVVVGGGIDRADRYVAPTVMTNVQIDSPLMREEVFGPILPVIPVSGVDEAISFVNERPKPLALYLFSGDEDARQKVLQQTSSGGVCMNDVLMHITVPGLPFGGVGNSGMGAYHGHSTFQTFSHAKGILARPETFDIPLRYPPYTPNKLKWIRRLT